jgi:hypothetical protein
MGVSSAIGVAMQALRIQAQSARELVKVLGEEALFKPGDHVRISAPYLEGQSRLPRYALGKQAIVEALIERAAINIEEDGLSRSSVPKVRYYHVGIPLSELWPCHPGLTSGAVRIEVLETWLERTEPRN